MAVELQMENVVQEEAVATGMVNALAAKAKNSQVNS